MPNVLKRRSLFQTNIDPDAIKINVFADEKFSGSLILSSEDLRMLVKITNFSKNPRLKTKSYFRIYQICIVQHSLL